MRTVGMRRKTKKRTLVEKNIQVDRNIEEALDKYVRPLLAAHGGNLEVLRVEEGIVYFQMKGACAGCSAADLTSEDLVNRELANHVPGFRKAVLERQVSQDLIDQARSILHREKSSI